MGKIETATSHNLSDFSFLDSDQLAPKYIDGTEQNRMTFFVEGVSCGSCVRKLERLPETVNGLVELKVELPKKLAYIQIDPHKTHFSQVADAIQAAGFNPIPLLKTMNPEESSRKADRAELIRLAVAGALAGNIMTFAVANYLGASDEWSWAFSWIMFGLYLPVLFYVALPFYRGAWSAIRGRRISIDLPMAVASLAGFIFSTVELLRGRDDIYYDSLAGFLFLILLSRFLQSRMQKRFLQPNDILETLQLQRARRIDAQGHWSWVSQEQLKPGDQIRLQSGETASVDGVLVSEKAHFSMAWLSGESKTHTYLRGAPVVAGARLLAGEAVIEVRAVLQNTEFGRLLTETRRFTLAGDRTVQESDRWAQILLVTVFTIAVAFTIFAWPFLGAEALTRALALIVLACPCAMAFGTPLALSSAINKAQKNGIIIRDSGVFESIRHIRTIFFDKTGTLTDTDLTLIEDPNHITEAERSIILSLENQSLHPIAFAFRKAFEGSHANLTVSELREIPGQGVEGLISGQRYALTRSKSATGTSCTFSRNGELVRLYHFHSQLKRDTHLVLKRFRKEGYSVQMLSGDAGGPARRLGEELEFKPWEIHHALSPEGKAAIVALNPDSMVIGDGVNDSLALMKASVGVAVSGGVEAALRTSRAMLTENDLIGVWKLFEISREAFQLVRQNLTISVIYNSIGGVLALCGYINPLVAAVLMPVSSGFILLSTWVRNQR